MELALVIWAVGTLPAVSSWLCFILFIAIVISCILAVVMPLIENDSNESEVGKAMATKYKGVAKTVLLWSIPFYFLFLLMPDKTTAYQMLAAYGVQSVAENPKAQELASDGVDVLQALMKKAKDELEK